MCWAWGVLARVVGWALGCGVSARDVGGSLFFSDLLSLVVVGCFGLLPFPQFLGEVLSVFLFFWALGSCILWLCGFAFWK